MWLLSSHSCITMWDSVADVTTKCWIFILFHVSSPLVNTQTPWTFMRLKNSEIMDFCSSLTFSFHCLILSSTLPRPPGSDKKEGRSPNERVEARSVDSAVRCWSYEPKQQQWRWELRYSLLCCQQKIIIETRNKKKAAKKLREVRAASVLPGRKGKASGPGQHALGAHYFWDKITK